jgi:hypothetical protein
MTELVAVDGLMESVRHTSAMDVREAFLAGHHTPRTSRVKPRDVV